jgi:hypothetical protein
MAEEVPDSYPASCKTRAALQNFDMSVFSEDFTNKKIAKEVRDLASKLEHSKCLSENHGFDNYGPIPKVTIVKEPDSINKDVANEKNRSMFTPKMLGLNTPEQDLHNLGEFERLTSK